MKLFANTRAQIREYFNANPKSEKFARTVLEYGVLILVFLCLRSSVFGNYRIPTASMVPTLQVGDHLFANKLAYSLKIPFTKKHIIRWGTPQRGDVVSFKYPQDEWLDYTKRVIGLPGDKVAVVNKRIILNGKMLDIRKIGEEDGYTLFEEDLNGVKHVIRHSSYALPIDDYAEITVPANMYFVMGDNRDNSSDSRVWGFVPLENFDGRLGFRWAHIEVDGTIAGILPRITKISFERFGLL